MRAISNFRATSQRPFAKPLTATAPRAAAKGRPEIPVALVTGASGGIGRAIAERIGLTSHVAVHFSGNKTSADAVVEKINAQGAGRQKAFAVQADLSALDCDATSAMMDAINANLGALPTIFVDCAGKTADNKLILMSDAEFDSVTNVNYRSVFRLAQRLIKDSMMKARWGRLVFISSIMAIWNGENQFNYAASKSGILAMSRSVAREYGARGITSNAVLPGFIKTPMTEKLGTEIADLIAKMTPVARLGQPEDVAAMVDFLVSANADFITGQQFVVDGGLSSGIDLATLLRLTTAAKPAAKPADAAPPTT